MPNWCENDLTITCDKKHSKELLLFKTTASARGLVKKKDLESKRKEWLKVHEAQYKQERAVSQWLLHHTMPVADFFVQVLQCRAEKNGDMSMGESDLSMRKIMPCPHELTLVSSPTQKEKGEDDKQFKERVARHKKQYGHTNWYDWQISNWGTKWDIDADLNSETKTQLNYYFNSAWSPPTEFIASVARKFPNLHFELNYEEPGMCFKGTTTAHGEEFDDHCESYTPSCHECEEEYDDNGDCACSREVPEVEEVVAEKKTKKKKK